MDWSKLAFVALILGGAWQGAHLWRLRPIQQPDGVLAPDMPRQSTLQSAAVAVTGRWTLTPRAEYDITARILSREDYSYDQLASLVPEDLALGWGLMSDNRLLNLLDISQGARFYSWRPHAPLPVGYDEIITHSANTHVIPATSAVKEQLARLRKGQVVHLTGYLVDGVRQDGYHFATSLTRTDTGAGACEVVLVETVEIL